MGDMNVSFCRLLLSALVEEFRAEFPHIRVTKHAWVINAGFRDHWEFHAESPAGEYYWHGHADNAYDARYKGWIAWRERERNATLRANAVGFVIKPNGVMFELRRFNRESVEICGEFETKGDAADEAVRLNSLAPKVKKNGKRKKV